MLRLTACFLIAVLLFTINSILNLQPVDSVSTLTRLTNTPEHALNLNPTLSDDGRVVVFESSADLSGGQSASFQTFRAELAAKLPAFSSLGSTRAVSPGLSSDGRIIVFASTEDLVGKNADRNSEIFLFDGSNLRQLTLTQPASDTTRLTDGNFQPSVTGNGRTVAFSSNRDFRGLNVDQSHEIFLYDTLEFELYAID